MMYHACENCGAVCESDAVFCGDCLVTVAEISDRIHELSILARTPYGFLLTDGGA